MASQWSSWWGRWGRGTRCSTFGLISVEEWLSKVKALVEERGGVLLEKAFGLDAEHVIRFLLSSSFARKYSASSYMFNKGCWWGQSYLPIDHMTCSSTGRWFVISQNIQKSVAFLQLCDGLHKDWHCPWKPSRLQGDELTSAFSFQFFFFFSGGDHLSILLWRVQPGGGASGKVEVERGAGKWRDRLRSGRSRTRWGCRVQVSFGVWVDSRHFLQGFQVR